MQRSFSALIFDMDGVLVDSEPLHYAAEKELHKQLGITVPKSLFHEFVGLSLTKMWERLKKEYSLRDSVDDLVEHDINFRGGFFAGQKSIPLIPGIKTLLERLKASHIPITIASSSSPNIIDITLQKSGLDVFFDHYISGQDVTHGKPAPDIYLKAAELLNIDPASCLVIEDARNGIIAAKEAGMFCIGFKSINSGNQDLSIADKVVEAIDAGEILSLFEL